MQHAAVIAPREPRGEVRLDRLAVLEQIERHEEDDDEIDGLAEEGDEDGKRTLERIDARVLELEPEIVELVLQDGGVFEERQFLHFFRDLREVCHEAREGRQDGARDEREEREEQEFYDELNGFIK